MRQPEVSLIWAQDRQGLIGRGSSLPWRLPEDMAWFRRHTMGKPILMGRKTFDSIGRALPGRLNLIQSRGSLRLPGDCVLVRDFEEALQAAAGCEELMIIGGREIYRLWLPRARRLYVTCLEWTFSGDVYFPVELWDEAWRCRMQQRHRSAQGYDYTFRIYERDSERVS